MTFPPMVVPTGLPRTGAPAAAPTRAPKVTPRTPPTVMLTDAPSDVVATGAPQTTGPTTRLPGGTTQAPGVEEEKEGGGGGVGIIPDKDERQLVRTTGGSIAAAAALGGGAAGATRLLVMMRDCRAEKEYPLVLHPTQMSIGGSVPAGVVVGNIIICVAVYLVGLAVLWVMSVSTWVHDKMGAVDQQGFLRFPSMPLAVFALLYQGSSLAAMALVLHAPSPETAIVGVAGVGLCIVVPLAVLSELEQNVHAAAYYRKDAEMVEHGPILRALIGPGEWVSRHRYLHWIYRWASVVRHYNPKMVIFYAIDMAATFALSAVSSAEVDNDVGCGHVKLVSAIVFLMLLALEIGYAPHCIFRNTVLDVLQHALMAAALLFSAGGYYVGDGPARDTRFTLAHHLIFTALGVLAVRTLLDIIAACYVVCTGRHTRLQEEAFEESARGFEIKSGEDGSLYSAFPVLTQGLDGSGVGLNGTARLSPIAVRTRSSSDTLGDPTQPLGGRHPGELPTPRFTRVHTLGGERTPTPTPSLAYPAGGDPLDPISLPGSFIPTPRRGPADDASSAAPDGTFVSDIPPLLNLSLLAMPPSAAVRGGSLTPVSTTPIPGVSLPPPSSRAPRTPRGRGLVVLPVQVPPTPGATSPSRSATPIGTPTHRGLGPRLDDILALRAAEPTFLPATPDTTAHDRRQSHNRTPQPHPSPTAARRRDMQKLRSPMRMHSTSGHPLGRSGGISATAGAAVATSSSRHGSVSSPRRATFNKTPLTPLSQSLSNLPHQPSRPSPTPLPLASRALVGVLDDGMGRAPTPADRWRNPGPSVTLSAL